jgi:hypothetical protein
MTFVCTKWKIPFIIYIHFELKAVLTMRSVSSFTDTIPYHPDCCRKTTSFFLPENAIIWSCGLFFQLLFIKCCTFYIYFDETHSRGIADTNTADKRTLWQAYKVVCREVHWLRCRTNERIPILTWVSSIELSSFKALQPHLNREQILRPSIVRASLTRRGIAEPCERDLDMRPNLQTFQALIQAPFGLLNDFWPPTKSYTNSSTIDALLCWSDHIGEVSLNLHLKMGVEPWTNKFSAS